MVRLYPYQLWAAFPAQATRTSGGDFVAGGINWVLMGKCRDEGNAKGSIINLEDGQAHTYDSLIQLPRSVDALPTGMAIEVRDGSTVRVNGTVKRSITGQLHNQVWV